ncbi:MAG: hypothetical protein HY961_16415 [Ignavibacteriae bacterium]|nr:hypothetical protein [Ignavibacteriota bacterium]
MLSLTEIRKHFRCTIKIDEPAAPYCALGVGGPADYLFEVSNENEAAELRAYFSRHRIPHVTLQSTTLVSDRGIRGAAICFTNRRFTGAKAVAMFKPPENQSIDALIHAADVNGILWGGAEIIGGTVANMRGATAADIFALVTHAQRIIRDRCGVDLEMNFDFVGFDQEQLARVA